MSSNRVVDFRGPRRRAIRCRCYATHPALDIGDGRVVYGGSCFRLVVDDADVYVGLSEAMHPDRRALPWVDGYSFVFPIADRAAPDDPEDFAALVAWLSDRLDEGLKVHVGCFGGHGRTGTVLAALSAYRGVDDAIAHVRAGYCSRAVESKAQVRFLVDYYGCAEHEPTDNTRQRSRLMDDWTRGRDIDLDDGGPTNGD